MVIFPNLIDILNMSAFSSPWYWLAFAVIWQYSTAFFLGVPFKDIRSIDLNDEQQIKNIQNLVVAYLEGRQIPSVVSVFLSAVIFTVVFLFGFLLEFEFMQASFFLLLPMWLAFAMNLSLANIIIDQNIGGTRLINAMIAGMKIYKVLAMVFISLSVIIGLYIAISPSFLVGI